MTLNEAFETMVLPCKVIRRGTLSAARTALKWFNALVPAVGTMPIEQITSRELAMFKVGWSTTGLKPQTFNKCLRHIRGILRDLFEMDLITKLPRCKELPEDDPEVRIADGHEVEQLYLHAIQAKWPIMITMAAADYWRALIVVAVSTGLRKSDILSIKRADVDLTKRVLFYRAVKTGKRRAIPLAPFACDHLAPLIESSGDGESVFYSTSCKRQFYREWHRIQKAAGINPPVDVHDLRRTCGSYIYGVAGLNAASEMLAHSSVAVTRRHYISTSTAAESLRPAVDSMPNPADILRRHKTEGPEKGGTPCPNQKNNSQPKKSNTGTDSSGFTPPIR